MPPASEGVEGTKQPGQGVGPGTLVNGIYRLVRCMGSGGMGEVWEALHERTKGRVALKLLLPEMGRHREVLLRFQREVEVTSALNHPNIVRISDADELPDGRPFLVMEFLEGHDLSTVAGPLPLAQVCDIIEQTARGLHAAHCRSIVHRDLKPANIFITPLPGTKHRVVKILDFGISKALNGLGALTQTHSVMGTPNYMAPEQATGGNSSLDARADQFSLAAITYELITGRMAFEGEGMLNVLYKVVHTGPASFASLGLDLPPAVEAIVMRGLSKAPRERFDSVLEFGRALKRAADPRAADSSPVMPVSIGDGSAAPVSSIATPRGASGKVRSSRPTGRAPASFARAVRAERARGAVRTVATGAGRSFERLAGRASSAARAAVRAVVAGSPALSPDRLPDRSTNRRFASLVLGLLAIGAGSGIYLWWTHRPGKLLVTAVPADATIHVDGIEPSARSPLTAEPSPGVYTVSVARAGYDRSDQRVEVKPGQVLRLEVVLDAAADTGLEIVSEPPGELVWLDGSPMPGPTGQARTDIRAYRIPPGRHRLEVKGNAHLVPWQEEVVVEAGSINQVRAILATVPTQDPGPGEAVAPGATATATATVEADADAKRRSRASAAGPHPTPVARVMAVRVPAPALASATCNLAVGTRPWSEVWIDGQNTGKHTPYAGAIACGQHRLTFKRGDLGLERNEAIRLGLGEAFRQSWPLEPGIEAPGGRERLAAGPPAAGGAGPKKVDSKLGAVKVAGAGRGVSEAGAGASAGDSLTVAVDQPLRTAQSPRSVRPARLMRPAPKRSKVAQTQEPGQARLPQRPAGIDSASSARPLRQAELAAGMNAVKSRLRDCYGQREVPAVAIVNVNIAKSGKVTAASVRGPIKGTAVGACVERVVKSATFPLSDGLRTPFPFNLP